MARTVYSTNCSAARSVSGSLLIRERNNDNDIFASARFLLNLIITRVITYRRVIIISIDISPVDRIRHRVFGARSNRHGQ